MNLEKFVNDYLKEHRHDVLLNPYSGLIDFAKAFKRRLLDEDEVDEEHKPAIDYIKEQEERLRWLLEPDATDDYYENNW